MPTVDAYRRAPLLNSAFVPLVDAAVQTDGLLENLIRRVLEMAQIPTMSPLDAVLASKLGGYDDLPPMPNVEAAAAELQDNPKGFILLARAALMTASATRNKNGMLRILSAMRTFLQALPALSEDVLMPIGADAFRLAEELYRRTGQPFLLTLLERLRAQLPDVSGLMHSFPFPNPYVPAEHYEANGAEYHQRMQRLATGSLAADSLALTSLISLYSGSGRDHSAPAAGMTAFRRYHGMPTGAFSADPYLAGRDPARAVDLPAVCAQIEALADVLATGGNLVAAELMEMMLENALPDLIAEGGIRTIQPVSRLAEDESVTLVQPEPAETTALLRALYALRRSIWMAKETDELALLFPVSGGCLTRFNGVPVRLVARSTGTFARTMTISVEVKQPVSFTLHLRVPSYVSEAVVSFRGKEKKAVAGSLFAIKETFHTGDTIVLHMVTVPRLEAGYRGSVSVLCGPTLMTLPIPEAGAGYQYALVDGTPLTPEEDEAGRLCVYANATDAPEWVARDGFITPVPRDVQEGAQYKLKLMPFSGTTGRVAQFPRAARA